MRQNIYGMDILSNTILTFLLNIFFMKSQTTCVGNVATDCYASFVINAQ